jgi:Tol biopolymer transport system component/imidazolonepropionase-like amidohydrolase
LSTSRNASQPCTIKKRPSRLFGAFAFAAAGLALLPVQGRVDARTLEFDVTEVTQPALSVAPDGRSFIFNLLGHLFRLPASGGAATQLTFGPFYDSEPVLSPDGAHIAFISNRDGSDGNLFVLDVASGKMSQLTHEFQVAAPVWSPDGKTLAYISLLRRDEYPKERIPGFGGGDTGSVFTVTAQGGTPQRVSDSRTFVSVFFLHDGRLAWTIAVRDTLQPVSALVPAALASTTLEVRSTQGTVSRLGSLPGALGRIAFDPSAEAFYFVAGGNLRHYSLGDADSTAVGAFPTALARLDAARGNAVIYAAADAKLWRVSLPGGDRQAIDWHAHVKMEVAERIVRKWSPPANPAVPPRAVLTPRLSPDGRTLVFMAAGSLWEQTVDGTAPATKLIDEAAFQCDPAFSPDGRQLAFISDNHGKREVRVLDFASHKVRALTSVGGASWALFPSWSSDGKSLVFQRTDQISDPYRFIRLDAAAGNPVELGKSGGSWTARPHFSADGSTLYYTGRVERIANFYKLSLRAGSQPEAVTDLTRHVHDGLVSADGKWLAYRRNSEIWLGRMEPHLLKDQDFRRISSEGGRSFAFTPDSSALLYSEGPHVWRRPLQGGTASEIPIRLTLPRATEAPLLISHVRVLDLQAGKFGADASMLIEQGRIRWIGQEVGHTIPANAVRLDGGGRYAIPGLTDSHTHTAWANQQITEESLIAYGVTSVRDTGSRLDLINALQDRGDSTHLPVPRYFASGDIFEGFMPLWGDAFLEITNQEEAREYVKHWKDLGAGFIKVYTSLPWYLKSLVATEARRAGLPVVGHGLSVEEIVRSVTLGFSTLEHSGPANEDIIKLLASSGVKLDPTLTIGAGTRSMLAGDPPPAIDEKFRTYVPEDAIKAARPGGTFTDAQRATLRGSLSRLLRAYQGGVKLLDGTDALMTGIFFGPSVHWELQFFNEADISAIDVLRIATLGAAETNGSSADLGSLDPGKLGDVVLLDADPLENIRNTMKIWRVIKEGQVFDPSTLR